MKIPDIKTIAGVVDIMLDNWQISALAMLAFAVLCIGLFGGFKKCINVIIALLCVGGALWAAAVVVDIAQRDVEEIIDIAVAWAPTVLFTLILATAVFVGYLRGLRKSLVLFAHSACAAAVCLTAYFICVSSEAVDGFVLTAVNAVMGGDGALQGELGVSADCVTLRQVLIGFITNLFDGDVSILLSDNAAYLSTLADMAFKTVFAVVFYAVYLIIVFILYLIYHACYSERKYRRKKTAAVMENRSDCVYRKHPVGGGVVGLVRGLAAGLVSLSFLGGALFIVAGTGEGKLKDYSFGDKNTDFIYSVYRSVESYGSQGIFKILNAVKDSDDVPYYLFAADLVFSGGLKDEPNGIEENISFVEELGAYTEFARDTFSLLMKYGGDTLAPMVSGGGGDMDGVIEVISDPAFAAEFEHLVSNFDSKTYFINFSLSLVNSVVANIDEMSFADGIGEDNKELLKVLFKSGYLSETIPDERELKKLTGSDTAARAEDMPPSISVNKLLTKKDVKIALDIVLSLLAERGDEGAGVPEAIKALLPRISGLSLLSTERAEELNPVLGRLYCYIENAYLTDEGQDGIRYSEVKELDADWNGELRRLISAADGLFTLYGNIYDPQEPLNSVLSIFDESNENYAENISIYDGLCESVADSVLLGRALASNKITNVLREQLSAVGENIYVPDKMVYENTYGEDGSLISRGETYYLLYGLRLLGGNEELIEKLLASSEQPDIIEILDCVADAFGERDKFGNTLAVYLTESTLLRSVISDVLTEKAGGVIAVPSVSLERVNGECVNLVVKDELKEIFDALPDVIELIKPLADEGVTAADIVKLIDDKTLNSLLDGGNGIIEGTVASHLIKQCGTGGSVVIPARLSSFENWVSFGSAGELQKLLSAVRLADIDFEKLLSGGFGSDEMFDVLNGLDDGEITEILKSDVIHYTISDYLQNRDFGFGDFSVIIPASSKITLQGDVIASLVKKEELSVIFSELKNFGLDSGMTASDVVRKLVAEKQSLADSNVISASVVNFIMCNDGIRDALNLPEKYVAAGERTELERYGEANIWHGELPSLITALDEIFEISAGGQFEINSDTLSDRVNELLKSMNKPAETEAGKTKLQVCYGSEIVRNEITAELDKALDGVVNPSVLAEAKQDGYYKLSEMQALSDAADILGLDFLNLGSDELTDKVKAEIMHINEKREDFGGRSTLDVIYPSAIIRHMMTEQLDKALPESAAEKATLDKIKGADGVYSESEFSAMVTAVNTLGINSVDDIRDFGFTEFSEFSHNLGVVYSSDVLAAVLTKSVSDAIEANPVLADHPSAYRPDIKIYRQSEIECIISLLGDGDIGEYSLGAAWEMKRFILPDTSGEPSSYIISATLTKNLLANDGLTVPRSAIAAGLIRAEELALLIDAFDSLNGGASFEGWHVEGDMAVPEPGARAAVAASAVMRATLTDFMTELNGEVTVAAGNAEADKDSRGRDIAIISESQIIAIFDVIAACGEDRQLKIPSFDTVSDVAKFRGSIPLFFTCDSTRYAISAVLQAFGAVDAADAVVLAEGEGGVYLNPIILPAMTAEEAQRILERYDF